MSPNDLTDFERNLKAVGGWLLDVRFRGHLKGLLMTGLAINKLRHPHEWGPAWSSKAPTC